MKIERTHPEISDAFERYSDTQTDPTSNATGSYVRAISKLNHILKNNTGLLSPDEDLWLITDTKRLSKLYDRLKEEQKLTDGGFFKDTVTSSYWKNRFYSSAIKMFIMYLDLGVRQNDMLKLASEAQDPKALAKQLDNFQITPDSVLWDDEPVLDDRTIKERLPQLRDSENHAVFRKMILENFRNRCCLTGLPLPDVLVATHISSWEKDKVNRMNPENGLCLAATYHTAFTKHLISFDEDYRLILAPSLKEYTTHAAFNQQFARFEGCPIEMPVKFHPSQELLQKHRSNLI